jgi:NADH-quinone oxidoreductase subunit M
MWAVDGISIAMILLTSFVVLAGVLVSWKMEKMNKEFFLSAHFLSLGAYGYFMHLISSHFFSSLKLQ